MIRDKDSSNKSLKYELRSTEYHGAPRRRRPAAAALPPAEGRPVADRADCYYCPSSTKIWLGL